MKKILCAALALTLVFTMSLSAFAISYDDNLADVLIYNNSYDGETFTVADGIKRGYSFYYHVDKNTGAATLWMIESADIYIEDGRVKTRNDIQLRRGVIDNAGNVLFNAWYEYNAGGDVMYVNNLDWSSINIYSKDGSTLMFAGENFPVPPLAEQIQEVTNLAMEEEMAKMSQTVRLLTVCGIGLMALLIGLALFGKRSLLFRN